MSSTLTHSTTSTTAIPAQRTPRRRARPSRTTWAVAGAAAVMVAAAGATVAVAVRSSDDPAAPAVSTVSSADADAAESSHGFGPGVPAADQAVRLGPEAVQLVHGTRGALRDAAGRPLAR